MNVAKNALGDFSVVGLSTTRLSRFLEDRVNCFLHNNGVITGDITIRMVSNTVKIFETRLGMKNRSVLVHPCACVFVGDVATNTGIDIIVY